MKRILCGAMLALCLPIVALAQVATEAGAADTKALVFTFAGSAAGVVLGWVFKKSPIPNGMIPGLTGVIAALGLVFLAKMPVREAVLAAMAVVGGSVTMYETPKALPKPGGGS